MTPSPRWGVLGLLVLGVAGCVVVAARLEHGPPPVVVSPPRAVDIPPGHYPPPGHCRLWYPGRAPGQQPPPVRCDQLRVQSGAFILYQGAAWDSDYDWKTHARRHPGSVPPIIIELTTRR
jgi:hypothetical protein